MGVGAAVKNLLMQPIYGIQSLGNAISGNTYENKVKETNKLREEVPQSCADLPPPEGPGGLKGLGVAMGIIRDTACTCRPWGTCPPTNCDCKALCPDSFDIFAGHQARNTGDTENELQFSNDPYFFSQRGSHPMTPGGGYCWGHASVTAKFNRLAFFDSQKKAPVVQKNDPGQFREFYSNVIGKILKNEATEIPGFANLKDFSKHPVIQDLLADRVAEEWADKAMTFSGLGTALGSSPMEPAKARELVKDIERRTKLYQSPQIVFTVRDQKFFTHTLLVSEVRRKANGAATLCLRDNNSAPDRRGGCNSRMELSSSGKLSYGGELGEVTIAHNEDADTLEQAQSLTDYCRLKKGCKAGS